ncbi:hypothetical protein QYE76_033779 [Lolium multiflorum]|uniref:Retrotransposon gag domain-containing protein n=1 Tax=Lolium multiflorum TaxID=4521 RepID=A0AAD8QXP8_LOLMU|nr:hypothetical protein QYE76_033779 [Lolium multiflorum]
MDEVLRQIAALREDLKEEFKAGLSSVENKLGANQASIEANSSSLQSFNNWREGVDTQVADLPVSMEALRKQVDRVVVGVGLSTLGTPPGAASFAAPFTQHTTGATAQEQSSGQLGLGMSQENWGMTAGELVLPMSSPITDSDGEQTQGENEVYEDAMAGTQEVFIKTLEDHAQHLQQVLAVLEQQGLKVKKSKCAFAKKEIVYLGHIISAQGVSTDKSKVAPIIKWQPPANVKELRSFLDFSKTFIVETDACGKGVGAVLIQDNHPLVFIIKALGPRNKGLSTYEKECLAILMAVDKWSDEDIPTSLLPPSLPTEDEPAVKLKSNEVSDNKIVNQENKNSVDIITWREYEALRNEMRREFRTKDDELKDMRLAIENLTAQQQDDDEDPELEDDAHNARGAPRGHRPRGWVPLGRNGRGQDEEDGLGKPKFSIPKFEGGADVEEYLTWELKIEKLWSLHPNYSEDKKIKLASSEFDGYALCWWDSLVRNRDEDGAQPIRTWRAMKEVMTSRFVPTNYMQNIFDKLSLLRQGVKTVDEYYMEMEMLMQRGRVRESLEMTMQRFVNGLNWLKKQRLRDVLREVGVLHPCAYYGAFDALCSLLYSA